MGGGLERRATAPLTVRGAGHLISQALSGAPVQCSDTGLHAIQILEYILGMSRAQYFMGLDAEISPADWERLKRLVDRRIAGEPWQYLVGYAWFWESPFEVGPGVLIPRKETELLVEALLGFGSAPRRVAELGAGSGNVGISVLRHFPNWEWHGFEINPGSFRFIEANLLGLLGLQARYHLYRKSFFGADLTPLSFDFVVSNPPYIVTNDLRSLSLEVQCEPVIALDGGADGQEVVRRFFIAAWPLLKSGGIAFCELGQGQGAAVQRYLIETGWSDVSLVDDYAGIARMVQATKKGTT